MNVSIKELKHRLQVVLLLVTFFPVITDILFETSVNHLAANSFSITWGATIALVLFVYLFFETVHEAEINRPTIVVTDYLLLINIFAFAVLLIILAGIEGGKPLLFSLSLMTISLNLIVLVPLILVIFISLNIPVMILHEIRKKRHMRKLRVRNE